MLRIRLNGPFVWAAVLTCFLPVGCNLNPDDGGESNKSELKRFESEAELLAYMRGQITLRSDAMTGHPREEDNAPPGDGGSEADGDGGSPTAAPGDADYGSAIDEYSQTTTQEEGVEEADVVKTDGQNLYVISTRNEGSVLRIVGLGENGETQLLSETALEGYGRDLYLHGSVVVALTGGGGFVYPILFDAAGAPAAGEEVKDETLDAETAPQDIGIAPLEDFVYERPNTRATVIDVSDPASPVISSSTKIDGTAASSRMINGVMHLVLANYQDYYYDVLPRLGDANLDVSEIDSEMILPKYTRTNADGTEESGIVVTWENLYRPADPDGFGVVTVVNMDIDDDARFTAVGVVAEPGLVYSSIEALYLTDTNYTWDGNARATTDIYKFKYEGRGATPVAFGTVAGRILNQYSMGEHNGHLRVATTIDPTWDFDGTGVGQVTESTNNIYVLGQDSDALSVVGRIENIAPGESIQSARFLGDRGFLVTFRQIDPLFTVDLADPDDPRLVGELKVPGFSTFLTPIDANHLLAVGQYIPPPETPGNWGVQLSIFDVTDFANPTVQSNVILGADANISAYSEALWDPKALTFFPEGGVVALPMSIYDYTYFGGGGFVEGEVVDGGAGSGADGSTGSTDGADAPPPDDVIEPDADLVDPQIQGFQGIYVYSVSTESGLTELGRVSTQFDEAQYWGAAFTRGVFVGDDLFAVTDLGVHSASLSDLTTIESELFFGLPYDYEEPPVVTEPDTVDPDGTVDPGTGVAVPIADSPATLGAEVTGSGNNR